VSAIDPLTGLANRQTLEQTLSVLSRRAAGTGCLVVDLDRFRDINDRFGMPAGDQVLCHVATILRLTLPNEATIARIGGDEFAVVLPATTLSKAMELAERIRRSVQTAQMPRGHDRDIMTISVGVAVFDPERHSTAKDVIAEACGLMGEAKTNRRNRVFGPPGHYGSADPPDSRIV
jgi:diguanylate cyclase (GGDEF)-like protein